MSTELPASTTAATPSASDVRIRVPALPGSRTSAAIVTRSTPPPSASARGTSRNEQIATMPAGATVSLRLARARSSTYDARGAAATSAAYCSATVVVTKTSTAAPPAIAASTACGPSARNCRRSARTDRRLSLRASLTRPLVLVSTAPVVRGTSGTRSSGGLRCVDVLGQRGLGRLHEDGERGRVVDGQVGHHPPVDLDAGEVQALDEPVVGHPVGSSGGIDALDPEPAEVTLARLAVAVAVDQ